MPKLVVISEGSVGLVPAGPLVSCLSPVGSAHCPVPEEAGGAGASCRLPNVGEVDCGGLDAVTFDGYGEACQCAALPAEWRSAVPAEDNPLRNLHFVPLREARSMLCGREFQIACKGRQVVEWRQSSRYCPRCGARTEPFLPLASKCRECGYEIFPRVTPAVIVRITRGDEILLVRAHNFRGDHYGLVAGFVEVGETFEEAVRREVMEETSLTISHLRYWGSQPWPFPSNVMVGYTAEWSGGELRLQGEELAAGAFFRSDRLPPLPDQMSIARRLIDEWVSAQRGR